MADFAGSGGSGGGGGVITPPIDPKSGVAMLTSLPEAGKIYNIPYVAEGLLVPVYIVDIQTTVGEEVPLVGTCLSCVFLGEAFNKIISWQGNGITNHPTLDIGEAEDGEGFYAKIDLLPQTEDTAIP